MILFHLTLTASYDRFARIPSIDQTIHDQAFRTLARSRVLLVLVLCAITHTRKTEWCVARPKVHVVVDHGSGNSRPPTVVQLGKTRNKKTSRDKLRFRSQSPREFNTPTATDNSPVHPRCIPPGNDLFSSSPAFGVPESRARSRVCNVLRKGCRTPRVSLICADRAIARNLCDPLDRAGSIRINRTPSLARPLVNCSETSRQGGQVLPRQ
ncbi:hypothetical protein PUN28_013232 [Cardiocondyla obscurior]|uniref:Uncharacterized protein n=1 Tax=Cardiocondyla obscurior TaxID=286306 RepID=A0AAW2F7J9_9HYME